MRRRFSVRLRACVGATALVACVVASAAPQPAATPRRGPDKTLLSCSIASEKPVYALGEVPKIRVRIKNLTGKDIYLVGSLDASDCKWRYPHCYYEVTGPNGKPATTGIGRCGNMNALRERDFVKVPNGKEFDPYQRLDGYGFFSAHQLSKRTFRVPGKYRIRFVYSTASSDIGAWLGDGRRAWKNKGADNKLATLFARVPKTTIRSNTIAVEITEPR